MDVMRKETPAGTTPAGAGDGTSTPPPAVAPPAEKRRRGPWPMVAGAVVAVALSGSMLVFGLNQQSAASDWKAKADTSAELLETARTDLTVARTESDAAKASRDTARGETATVRADLGRITSKYDCLLGANLHGDAPCDRHVLVKRLRASRPATDSVISACGRSPVSEP